MYLSRYNYTRRRNSTKVWVLAISGGLFLGVCAVSLLAIVLLIPRAGSLVIEAAGFQSQGDTSAVFEGQVAPFVPVLEMPISANQITLNVPQVGQQIVPMGNGITAETGTDTLLNQPVVQVKSDEAGLLSLCQQMSDLCSTGNEQVRNVNFDLRPNGLIVNAEVFIPALNSWQLLGLVMQLEGIRAVVRGVDIEGRLYSNAPAPYNDLIVQAETLVNTMLTQLSTTVSSNTYTLNSVYIDDQTITLDLR